MEISLQADRHQPQGWVCLPIGLQLCMAVSSIPAAREGRASKQRPAFSDAMMGMHGQSREASGSLPACLPLAGWSGWPCAICHLKSWSVGCLAQNRWPPGHLQKQNRCPKTRGVQCCCSAASQAQNALCCWKECMTASTTFMQPPCMLELLLSHQQEITGRQRHVPLGLAEDGCRACLSCWRLPLCR